MNKIIGDGLLGKSMANLKTNRDCLIIGAGVSNSGEIRASEFQREMDLVSSAIEHNKELRVVYFSTSSVNQTTQTPYIKHKRVMEKVVASLAQEWSIYRLPQVVGVVNNTTLICHIVRSVLGGQTLKVQLNAGRRIICIEDVVRVCELLLNADQGVNTVQNIAPGYSVSVLKMVEYIARALDKEPKYEGVNMGESYYVDVQPLIGFIGGDDIIFTEDYWCGVLDKYVPLLRGISSQGCV